MSALPGVDDALTRAAQAGYEAMFVGDFPDSGIEHELWLNVARAVRSASAPAPDRDALIALAHDAVDWDTLITPGRVRTTQIIAQAVDRLIEDGAVATAHVDRRGTPVGARLSQHRLAEHLSDLTYRGRTLPLPQATALAEFVLRWYDVREKTRGGDQ